MTTNDVTRSFDRWSTAKPEKKILASIFLGFWRQIRVDSARLLSLSLRCSQRSVWVNLRPFKTQRKQLFKSAEEQVLLRMQFHYQMHILFPITSLDKQKILCLQRHLLQERSLSCSFNYYFIIILNCSLLRSVLFHFASNYFWNNFTRHGNFLIRIFWTN